MLSKSGRTIRRVSRKVLQQIRKKTDITKIVKIAAVIVLVLFGISVLSQVIRSFVGGKMNSAARFFSNDYQFDAFTYQGVLYGGNKKWGKPNGPCAGIPARANGTEYSLGNMTGKAKWLWNRMLL